MPTRATLEKFIARVEENAHAEAIEEFYTENASMQENQAPPRVGRAALVAGERAVLAKVSALTSRCIRPYFVEGDRVAIRWFFRFEWRNGTVTEIEEVTIQRWEGELIVEETFFYDPAQMTPQKPASDAG